MAKSLASSFMEGTIGYMTVGGVVSPGNLVSRL